MPSNFEHQIIDAEERLRNAMLASDCRTLDALLSSDLIFTNHLGQMIGKQEDLELHRSGLLKFHSLAPSERLVKADAQLAIVSVRMKLSGIYDGTPFAGDLRYTRMWRQSASDVWQIVAGHSSTVQE